MSTSRRTFLQSIAAVAGAVGLPGVAKALGGPLPEPTLSAAQRLSEALPGGWLVVIGGHHGMEPTREGMPTPRPSWFPSWFDDGLDSWSDGHIARGVQARDMKTEAMRTGEPRIFWSDRVVMFDSSDRFISGSTMMQMADLVIDIGRDGETVYVTKYRHGNLGHSLPVDELVETLRVHETLSFMRQNNLWFSSDETADLRGQYRDLVALDDYQEMP